MVRFLDTSVFVRAYMHDENRHDEALRIMTSRDRLVASDLIRAEAVSAIRSAERAGRASEELALEILATMDDDTGSRGIVELIPLDTAGTIERAREIVYRHSVRTLDALHLAVADTEGRRLAEPDEELVFVTFDARQRDAAQALGLSVS